MTHGQKLFDEKYYRRFFDKYSRSEFEKYVNWADGWVRFLDRYLDIKEGRGRKLLELGSSLGYFARIFKDREFDVSASDISSYIVKKAGLLQKDINFFQFDIEKSKKLKDKYDFIFSFEVFEHLKNPEKALANTFNLLSKNGVFIFSTPFTTRAAYKDLTHINIHPEKWWIRNSKLAGFRKVSLVPATFIPFLYRFSKYLSLGFRLKIDLPFINSTGIYICKK